MTTKRSFEFSALLASMVFALGCSGVNSDSLAGSRWTVVEIEQNSITITSPQTESINLEFLSDSTFGAKTLCNSLSGNYEQINDSEISFSTTAITTALCPEDQVESLFVEQLNLASEYEFLGDTLQLSSPDNAASMKMIKNNK